MEELVSEPPVPSTSSPQPQPSTSNDSVTYHLVPGLSQKGGVLVSSDGFEYIRKRDTRRPHLDLSVLKCTIY